MPLSRDLRGPAPASATPDGAGREKLILCIALSWGLCAYFPVGVTYLHLFMMLFALAFSPQARQRMRDLRRDDLLLPLVLLLAWTLLATAVGGWYPDTGTRLFHIFRVALVLCMALALNAAQARAAIRGLLLGSVAAAAIVAAHQVWGLPDWAIWRSLLASRNNFSSGNMITMAMASGLSFFLGIAADTTPRRRWLALATALVLAATVALHAVSRNAQLLLVLLLLTALVCRFRSLRAALGGLVSVLLLVVVVWQFSPTTQSRFAEMSSQLQAVQTESPSKYGTSVGVRWRMYQEALQGMADHPVFGTGLGSWLPRWQRVWPSLQQQLPPDQQARFAEINNPHNDFLLSGMETGVTGMLLLAWLVGRFVRRGWQQRSTAGGITVVMGVAMFATASVNAPFRDAALGMTLLWLLGVSVAAHRVAHDA